MSRRVFLGSALEAGAKFAPVFDEGEAAVAVIAEPGKGKTLSVLTPIAITHQGSLFYVDFDGQMTRNIGLWREAMLNQEVHVFDPLKIVPDKYLPKRQAQEDKRRDYTTREIPMVPYRAGIGVIDYVARNSSPELAAATVGASMFPQGQLKEAHWSKRAAEFVAAALKFVACDPLMDQWSEFEPSCGRTMKTFYRCMTTSDRFTDLLELMSASENQATVDQAEAFLKASDNNLEMQGIRNQIRAGMTELFRTPGVLEMLDVNTVDFRTMRDKPQTIGLVIPGHHMKTLSSLVRLISTIMQAETEAAGVLPYGCAGQETLYVYDEAWIVGRHEPLLHCMAFHRKFGSRVVLAAQNLAQLEEVWGPSFKSFMGNVGTVEFFGGTSDLFTANYVAEISGIGTYRGPSVSMPGKPGDFGTESTNLFGRPLNMKDEVLRLPMPIAIIKKSGYQVSKCRIVHPSLSDFPEFCAFREGIEKGRSTVEAKRAAQKVNFPDEPAIAPAPQLKQDLPRKRPGNQWGVLDAFVAKLMGHETE